MSAIISRYEVLAIQFGNEYAKKEAARVFGEKSPEARAVAAAL